jgi:putative transposase
MRTSSGLPYRRSVRLTPSSYRDATIFLTICSYEKRCTFGRVEDDHVVLSPMGEIVNREWLRSKNVRPDVLFDEYTIMPNHMHALVCVPTADGSRSSLASLVRGFKGAVTRAVGQEVWQRGYHEHIVRDERELEMVRTYIRENPVRWAVDRYHIGE